MDVEEFRRAAHRAVDEIADLYASVAAAQRPVVPQVEPGYLVKALPRTAPEKGENIDAITADFHKLILPGATFWQHPSFFAYFPSNASLPSMLADMYSGAIGNPGFNWIVSPASTELESVAMDWAADLLGLHEDFLISSGKGGGVIQGTASDAALVAVVAARARFQQQHPDISADKLVIYVSSQTHSLGVKAGLILGLAVRQLPVTLEDRFSLRADALKAGYAEDRQAGLWPFVLIGTVGTTSSGAVDNLQELGTIIRNFPDFWLHVDAAWAGVAFACPEFRESGQLDAINQYADSFCTNFHKWGLVQFDCSAMWVRSRRDLTDALDITPEFLRSKHGDEGTVIDYRNWQIPLGRRFRSIKLWFTLRNYGKEGFREHIRKGVRLNEIFTSLIKSSSIFEIVTPPWLALTVFRLIPPQASNEESDKEKEKTINALNIAFHSHLNDGPVEDRIFITRTSLNGTICIRMAIGSIFTREEHVREAFTTMERVGRIILSLETIPLGGESKAEAEGQGDGLQE